MATLKHADYMVGWICALPIELEASIAMLNERHPDLPQSESDTNSYILGRIENHNVVMACLPAGRTGNNAAATVAMQMCRTFPSIRFGLMVGIGGAAPSDARDIRLGDVVVSQPIKNSGGVIQYDFGKTIEDGEFMQTGSLNAPPDVLLTAVSVIQADSSALHSLAHYLSQQKDTKFANPGPDEDQLFQAEYNHVPGAETCKDCSKEKLEERKPRGSPIPVVHYGTIASGNQVMRDGSSRERVRKKHDILCFEMEAAGLMNSFPCIVIRGMCDYADTHKNKHWQPYAAATASAYAKLLLDRIPAASVTSTATVQPTAWSFYLFSKRLFPLKKLILGYLVIDPCSPWDEYHPDSLEIADNDISKTHYPRIREIFESTKTSKLYAKLNKILSSLTGFSLDDFPTVPETTYFLSNSGKYFEKLCGQTETRSWLEKTIKYGMNVYMIVGIHTVRMPQIDPGLGLTTNSANEEQVLAVQYRKVGFKWYYIRAIERAFLNSECRWKVGKIGGRGSQDNEDEEDDEVVEPCFKDFIDEDDVKEEGESYSLGGELVVF